VWLKRFVPANMIQSPSTSVSLNRGMIIFASFYDVTWPMFSRNTLPVQDNEFDLFHQVNPPLVLVDGAHPQTLHVANDDVYGVYSTT
jgi:hypothetical protein